MHVPGFTAGASLHQSSRIYVASRRSDLSPTNGRVSPQEKINKTNVCYTVGNPFTGFHDICICCFEDTDLQQSRCEAGPC